MERLVMNPFLFIAGCLNVLAAVYYLHNGNWILGVGWLGYSVGTISMAFVEG